jgi:predicted phosphoribosyltransferase
MAYRVPEEAIEAVAHEEQVELERREREYRQGAPLTNLRGRIVIFVLGFPSVGRSQRRSSAAMLSLTKR